MLILSGSIEATLPDGSGGPVLAGPEAIFIAGRVVADAPTLVRIGPPGTNGDHVSAYAGTVATPDLMLRLETVEGDLLGQASVVGSVTPIEIYLTDLEEPDEIFVAVG